MRKVFKISITVLLTVLVFLSCKSPTSSDGGTTNTVSVSMVLVPGGTFNNGTANMTVSSFYIGKSEITQKQYKSVMGSIPSTSLYGTDKIGDSYPVCSVEWTEAIKFCNALSEKEGLQPVYTDIQISWATADFTKNGYRLPTEAEWEFAAREGSSSNTYTYSGSNTADDVAWYSNNAGSPVGYYNSNYGIHTVMTKNPNALQIFDMTGNVMEWCWDCYDDYPETDKTNYRGPDYNGLFILRGGHWSNNAYSVSDRTYDTYQGVNRGGDYIGFRVARSVPVTP